MRPLLVLLAAALLLPAAADARPHQKLDVVVVRGLTLRNVPQLAQRGAVGLLVPDAGPTTSASLAYAGIVRGVLYNERLGPKPNGPVLIHVRTATRLPASGLVLALPPNRELRNDTRFPIALLGACHGILDSAATRVPGLVSAVDVARTALAEPRALRCRSDAHAASYLRKLEQRIVAARNSTMAATLVVLALLLAFALLLPSATLPALAAAVAADLGLGLFPAGSAAAGVTLFALCVVAGGVLGRRLGRRPTALGLLLLALVGAHAIALALRPDALSLAPLGPELTSRFYGVSNVLETLLLVPTLVGATLLARRFGPLALVAAAAVGLVTIAENRLGADGGGAVVLGAAFTVLAIRRPRVAIPALGIAAIVVLALLKLDAALTGPDHLTSALAGPGALANVVAHRVPLAYSRLATEWYLVFPLGALVLLVLRTRVWPASRERRALVAAFVVAVGASLLVNDSPGPVALAAFASFLALEPQALRRELNASLPRTLAPVPAVARSDQP